MYRWNYWCLGICFPISWRVWKPQWFIGKEPAYQCRRCGLESWVRKTPWKRKWQPTPVFLSGESHGQKSLAGYQPWRGKESDMTEWLNTHAWTGGGGWVEAKMKQDGFCNDHCWSWWGGTWQLIISLLFSLQLVIFEMESFHNKKSQEDFPHAPVVGNPPSSERDTGSVFGLRRSHRPRGN